MMGQGVSSRSSHSCAAGRTTPSAKPCTHSPMSFWSWLSWREKAGWTGSVVVCSAVADIDGTLAFRRDACAAGLDGGRCGGRRLAAVAHVHQEGGRDERTGEREARAHEEGAVKAGGERGRGDRAAVGDVLRVLGRDGGEDGQPERAADLARRVHQPRG